MFAGKLRNPYFHHICRIGRRFFFNQKCMGGLSQGFKIGKSEILTSFRKVKENICLVKVHFFMIYIHTILLL